MTEPTLSTRVRAVQDELNAINNELTVLIDDARRLDLAPFHIAHLQAASDSNHTAWVELNTLAKSLELSGADHKL